MTMALDFFGMSAAVCLLFSEIALSSTRNAHLIKMGFQKRTIFGLSRPPFLELSPAPRGFWSKTGGSGGGNNRFLFFVKIVLSSTRNAHLRKTSASFFGRGLKAWFGQLRKWAPLCGDMRTFFRAPKSPQNWSTTKKLKKTCDHQNMSPLCGDTPTFAGEAAIFRTRRKSYKNADAGK